MENKKKNYVEFLKVNSCFNSDYLAKYFIEELYKRNLYDEKIPFSDFYFHYCSTFFIDSESTELLEWFNCDEQVVSSIEEVYNFTNVIKCEKFVVVVH